MEARLRSESTEATTKAKTTFATYSEARVNLVGHADLSGSPDYNLRLSLRRADAVRQALVARGITADRTNVTGVGDSEPAVPTARGVREPRNRFVSVTIR